jgi:broad specificity phosphatase PhoE
VTSFEAVYLARHGQTAWNVEGRKQGRLDSPLTAEGLAQVRRNAVRLSKEPIDGIFASPIGRAWTTAEIFATALRLPVQVVEDLSELDHGAWSGLTAQEIEAGWPGRMVVRERGKYDFRFPGGESYADADGRAGRALAEVARSGVRRPLLVSHEMIGRMLLKQLGVAGALGLGQSGGVVYCVTIRERGIVLGTV